MTMENKEYPSLLQQGKNLAKFSLNFLQYLQNNDNEENKTLIASDNIYNKRIETCKGCDRYDNSQNRCYECGCFLSVKAKFVLESCPLNKWSFDDKEWEEVFNNILNDMDEKKDDK
jgi:hypothetical protein